MVAEKVNINKKIAKGLNLAFVALSNERDNKFKNALARVRGFGKVIIAVDLPIGDVEYWRVVLFEEENKSSISICFPRLRKKPLSKNLVVIYADGVVELETIESLVKKITEELIGENQA